MSSLLSLSLSSFSSSSRSISISPQICTLTRWKNAQKPLKSNLSQEHQTHQMWLMSLSTDYLLYTRAKIVCTHIGRTIVSFWWFRPVMRYDAKMSQYIHLPVKFYLFRKWITHSFPSAASYKCRRSTLKMKKKSVDKYGAYQYNAITSFSSAFLLWWVSGAFTVFIRLNSNQISVIVVFRNNATILLARKNDPQILSMR